VETSVKHESVFVATDLTEETDISVPDRDGEGLMVVRGQGSIKRGSIFAVSKPTEGAGVSVP
jgi:hypothetical protein